MDRKNFLNIIGMSAAAFALISCVGCKKSSTGSSDTAGPTGVDFTLNLSLAVNGALLSNGGYLTSNGVIVAKTSSGNYIAVQRSCTHESYTLVYQGSNSRFYCANHGSIFSESGIVTNGPANRTLTTYHTELTGNILRVYS